MKIIVLSYSLPTKPSKARLHVWRQLKKIGAVNVESLWVVPHSKDKLVELQNLVKDIQGFNGTGMLLIGKPAEARDEERIKATLSESSNEEFTELAGVCDKFLAEIESEIAKENFIFAEVEENEEELEKIKKWYDKILKRSVYESPLRKTIVDKIKSCEIAFDRFSKIVFDRIHSEKKPVIVQN